MWHSKQIILIVIIVFELYSFTYLLVQSCQKTIKKMKMGTTWIQNNILQFTDVSRM